jgi:hypothetical protein
MLEQKLFRKLCVSAALVASLGAFAAISHASDRTAKAPGLQQKALLPPVTNGILSVQMDNVNGSFSVFTGASHPNPNQTVFYPCCTSNFTLRDATSSQMFVNNSTPAPGLSGYTTVLMPTPTVTTLGTTGFRATFVLANWTVVEDVVINGTTLSDTNVRQTVTVTNTSAASRQFGLRYHWDWEIAGNDGSFFRTRNPDSAFTGTPTTFVNPTFPIYEEVDRIVSPTFSVFATVTGGTLNPAPTTPDQLRYSNWPSSTNSAWDYADPGSTGDSSVVYFWGFNTPITLAAGASASFTEYVTTQLSAVTVVTPPPPNAPAIAVPTLTQWSLMLLSALALGLGMWTALRRKQKR